MFVKNMREFLCRKRMIGRKCDESRLRRKGVSRGSGGR